MASRCAGAPIWLLRADLQPAPRKPISVLAIFESILPIFLVMILGVLLRRWQRIPDGLWEGLESFGFYVVFPALLFITLYEADFTGLSISGVAFATLGGIAVFTGLGLSLWPPLHRRGISSASFTTVFQTITRWNGFVALAIADKLHGEIGLAIVALVMALILLPINFATVGVMVRFGTGSRSWRAFSARVATNPLILSCLAGLLARLVPGGLYEPAMQAVDLVARAALGLGLLMVGAGLRIRDALVPRAIVILPVILKLLVFPALVVTLAMLTGIRGEPIAILALCGAVPTAMNGYLLARQMGGDAPLYAAITTVQTAASFITIPLVLAVAGQFASG